MDCSILFLRDADGRMSHGDVVGVVVIDRSGEIVACTDSQSCLEQQANRVLAKGVMDDTSVTDILQLEQSLKDEGVGAFKVGQR
jgi:hypothetical protein